MAVLGKHLISLLLLISVVEGRVLSLYSSENHLISDGVESQESSLKANNTDRCPSACRHQYGFLPCADNSAGYVFLIVVYQVLLVVGGRLISGGSEVLFHIIGAGKFGGIIFRILMALPSMMLMILSGIFGSKEDAQSQVSVGVGIYAGITVFSLTIQWGMCMIYGKIDLKKIADEFSDALDSITSPSNEKRRILKDSGVKIDKKTSYAAGIMLLSLIPYIVLQLVFFFNSSSGEHIITLIALIISTLSLLSYFIYQIWDPWMQERSLKYSNFEIVRTGFLKHVKRLGRLVDQDGKLNIDLVRRLFAETDKDADKSIAAKEMRKLVSNILRTGNTNVEKNDAVDKVMNFFDKTQDGKVTEEEFIKGCKEWAYEAEKSDPSNNVNMSQQLLNLFKEKKENKMDKIMAKILKHSEGQLLKSESLITENGEPNLARIHELFNEFDTDKDKSISAPELKQLITRVKFGSYQMNEEDVLKAVFKELDKDNNDSVDEAEFTKGVKKYLDKAIQAAPSSGTDGTKVIAEFDRSMWREANYGKRAFFKSVFQVLSGIAILTFLGGPLMANILQLSHALGIPSFIISFVVVPLAMNAKSAVAALIPASKKSEETASWTFSEIYGGVIMNNMAGLTTLLTIVYAKDLAWNFSAEVLTILVVCGTMGILAFSRTTYHLWTCILAFLLYPFSLGFFYFVQISLYSSN